MRGTTGFPIRLRFAKRGKIRFISHRDVARAFERAFRIEALPLAFTLGFSPRPKVSFGLALSVGNESVAEYLDVELAHEVPLVGMSAALSAALPEGLDVTGVARLADRAPALQEAITAVEYLIEIVAAAGGPVPTGPVVAAAIDAAMTSPELETTKIRKGRAVVEDIRPVLRRLAIVEPTERGVLAELELATHPSSARPREVVAVLGEAFGEGRVLRTHQWIERDGARLEPLDADSPSITPHVAASLAPEVRAS
ncbi:MAG: TIGR03936 family radical SAM-associated protein [Acidimicrobiia bacterium]